MLNLFLGLITLFFIGCSNIPTEPMYDSSMIANPKSENFSETIVAIAQYPEYDVFYDVEVKDTPADGKRPQPMTKFEMLLGKLNLTPEQKEIALKLVAANKACATDCVSKLRETEKKVLDAVKEKEKQIKNNLKEGKITRDEARKQLNALKEETKAALKKAQLESNAKECLSACDAVFIKELKAILTQEQIVLLEKLLSDKTTRKGKG